MGGSAFVIFGELAEERQRPFPLPRNWFDRLLGRTRFATPRRYEGQRETTIEVACRELEVLKTEFRRFIRQRIPDPWPASKATIDFIERYANDLLVRGEQAAGEGKPKWYVQIGYSGCGGMGDTSASIAAHWTELWFAAERERITAQILRPFGFTPRDALALEQQFFPLRECGYAEIVRYEGEVIFAIDGGLRECPVAEPAIKELEAHFGALIADGKCRCQFCAPEFDVTAVKDLPL